MCVKATFPFEIVPSQALSCRPLGLPFVTSYCHEENGQKHVTNTSFSLLEPSYRYKVRKKNSECNGIEMICRLNCFIPKIVLRMRAVIMFVKWTENLEMQ